MPSQQYWTNKTNGENKERDISVTTTENQSKRITVLGTKLDATALKNAKILVEREHENT